MVETIGNIFIGLILNYGLKIFEFTIFFIVCVGIIAYFYYFLKNLIEEAIEKATKNIYYRLEAMHDTLYQLNKLDNINDTLNEINKLDKIHDTLIDVLYELKEIKRKSYD